MRILVTGASGLLGKEILNRLKEKSTDEAIFSPTRSELDLLDSLEVEKYLLRNRIDTIIHCAAHVGGIKANISNPEVFLYSNVQIDLNLIGISTKIRVPRLLYFGSSCMYPRLASQPMKESDILTGLLEPTNHSYAIGKIVGNEMVRVASSQLGLHYRTVILSNIYGLVQSEDPSNSHLIGAIHKKFETAISAKESEIEIWGTGSARREFTHVNDIAAWVSKNISRIHLLPTTLNLGFGEDFTVLEYYQTFSKLLGKEFVFRFNSEMPDGMPAKLMDSSIAKVKFGWKPEIGPIQGIQMLLDYRNKNISIGERTLKNV
jgi:GDP-L-fucose synthase